MEIVCSSCKKVFLIPDEKIPRDRCVNIICPSCRGKIQIDLSRELALSQAKVSEDDFSTTLLDAEIESILGGKRALICINDKSHQEAFLSILESMQYQTRISSSIEEAIERMRFFKYDVIILHEEFDGSTPNTNPILQKIKSMHMETRREIFFVLIGKEFKTLSNMIALVNSANLVVNEKDIPRIGHILPQTIKENERFYRIFKETKKEIERR
jgi:cupin superfamily acireductone dioxygenase involved in methionine salvage